MEGGKGGLLRAGSVRWGARAVGGRAWLAGDAVPHPPPQRRHAAGGDGAARGCVRAHYLRLCVWLADCTLCGRSWPPATHTPPCRARHHPPNPRAAFIDPYVGGSHGWVSVTPLNGRGPALLVLPLGGRAGVEGYRTVYEDGAPCAGLGTPELMLHTAAWAADWEGGGDPWNPPTSLVLPPNSTSYEFQLRMVLVKGGVRRKAEALLAAGRPAAHAVPGYVLATDMLTARLVVQLPPGLLLEGVDTYPNTTLAAGEPRAAGSATADGSSVVVVPVAGLAHGRARLVLRYNDNSWQSVHYFVLPPLQALAQRYGEFLVSAWGVRGGGRGELRCAQQRRMRCELVRLLSITTNTPPSLAGAHGLAASRVWRSFWAGAVGDALGQRAEGARP